MISVIICCYNSEQRLPQTLEHLVLQRLPDHVNWEVIVVDNNSTDNTINLAKEVWNRYGNPVTLRVVEEKKTGLIYAREKGVKEAKYEYLVFCDDDNWLDKNYLNTGLEIISKNKNIGALGGRSTVATLHGQSVPKWFNENLGAYAVGVQSEFSGDISKRRYLWGAGIFLRRSVMLSFYTIGLKHILTGRQGNVLLAGDDSEICSWLLAYKYKLWYSDKLYFSHFMPPNRLNKDYFDQMMIGLMEASKLLEIYWKGIDLIFDRKLYLSVIKKTKLIIKFLIKRDLTLGEKVLLQAHFSYFNFFGEKFYTIIQNLKLINHSFVK